jgi:colanic acid biosynthesis protein WcaH
MLKEDIFKCVIEHTNLFAFDLVIKNNFNQVLLAKRENMPAKGFWFVPGGRVHKNEDLNDAFKRILSSETGLNINSFKSMKQIGLYNHIYDENFFDENSFNTHYIVYSIELFLKDNSIENIVLDKQHNMYRFVDIKNLLSDNLVHQNVKNYFLQESDNMFNISGV